MFSETLNIKEMHASWKLSNKVSINSKAEFMLFPTQQVT